MTTIEILKKYKIENFSEQGNMITVKVTKDVFTSLATSLANEENLPLSSLYATDDRQVSNTFGVHVLFANDAAHDWLLVSTEVLTTEPSYPSLTATVMAAHWYERYLHDMFGITPLGHPDLRRLVSHENVPENVYPLRKDFAWNTKMEHANVPYPMAHVEGEGIYEIPVGPIHAGIIEPGHFRFNVAGERIITLEGKLFFTHKGIEKLVEGKAPLEALPFIERLSGDMAAGHALAFCQAVEALAGCEVPKRAQLLRVLLLELERVTMHIHDLANIGGMGTGFSFIAANGFRIKERMVRLSDELLGNRFWRGEIVPGGVAKDLSTEKLAAILPVLQAAQVEINKIVKIALSSDGFLDRLQTTGVLPLEAAKAFGGVGLPVRASGFDRDVRRDHPDAVYKELAVNVQLKTVGDVHARYLCRINEIDESVRLIDAVLKQLTGNSDKNIINECQIKDGVTIGAVESWRGEIICALHFQNGKISRCFPRDPSFCNWALFAIIGPGNIVPDFPLCNKSLNLSYSGTDM
ncbi:MAG: NADH-quinone oxidoreductase subunit C [Candidatus Falkowbacteria bacterium]